MLRYTRALPALLLIAACGAPAVQPVAPVPAAAAAAERPLPHPVAPTAAFLRAVERGTRTLTGQPGPGYWQQWASYRISARLDSAERTLSGSGRIVYHNRSPDTLAVLNLHLHQNLHAPGVIRNEPQEVTGGVELRRVAARGQTLGEAAGRGPGYAVDGTILRLRPHQPLLPGDSIPLEIDWSFVVPQSGAGRMGWDADDLFFIAYWFPQMAVYDDLVGWHTDPYRGMGEFYLGYADYEVTIDAPAGWVVRATGELTNPEQVFPAAILERLRHAGESDEVVHVLTARDFGPGRATLRGTGGRLRWTFRAQRQRDFTFSATRRSLWDAARAPVGDRTGDGRTDHTRVEALYRDSAPLWSEMARYEQHAIAFLSRHLAYPYPWPHVTAVEGGPIIGGGMEFPMLTLIGDYGQRGAEALYGVTAHELAHMWYPMIAGSDEKRHGWLDEGLTSFNTASAASDFLGRPEPGGDRAGYVRMVQGGFDAEIMTWTDTHPTPMHWGFAVYQKPNAVFATLRALIGEEAFMRGLRRNVEEWAYRHPDPWDLFHAWEREVPADSPVCDARPLVRRGGTCSLNWFWSAWFYETWTLDQAVRSVTEGPSGATIVVEDMGNVPMPARVTVTRADGEVIRREVPVNAWLSGARTFHLTVPPGISIARVEVDAEKAFPDINRANNVWER